MLSGISVSCFAVHDGPTRESRPMPSRSLPLSVLQQIDQLCDSFEEAWQGGAGRRSRTISRRTDVPDRTELFKELLAREVELRKKAGDFPSPADYLGRFGSYGDQVNTVFNDPRPRRGYGPAADLGRPRRGRWPWAGTRLPARMPDTTASRPGEPGTPTRGPVGDRSSFPSGSAASDPRRLLGQGNFLVFLAVTRSTAATWRSRSPARTTRSAASVSCRWRRRPSGWRTLDHPGIVKVHEFVPRRDGRSGRPGRKRSGFIVLEYIDGPTLEQVLPHRTARPARWPRSWRRSPRPCTMPTSPGWSIAT